MGKFEYKVITRAQEKENLESKFLTKLGYEGWELVCIKPWTILFIQLWISDYYFKRKYSE